MSELGRSERSLSTLLPNPNVADNILYNPPVEELRALSSDLEHTTTFGSPAYVTAQRSRSADKTRNAVDHVFDETDYSYIEDAIQYSETNDMVCMDRQLGRLPDLRFTCRLYVPKIYARIALTIATLLEPAPPETDPDFLTIQLPDWEETAIRVLPEEGLTTVLGSDYSGEAKKSFLRLFMYQAKTLGGLGLHAGSKRVTLQQQGERSDVGQLFLGLSATGKSTLTAHNLRLQQPEEAVMLQDDVCALLPDGTVAGSEGHGLYVKTMGLNSTEQPAMYDAVTHESSILENVEVLEDGSVDFDGDRYTSNGRAVIRRDHLSSAGTEIDLPRVDQIFFITRNPLMPPVCRLSPDEAAAAFMCGESIETSAGDPDRAGEPVRVVGTNPFIIGSKGNEGNRFRTLLEKLDVDAFVLNTGAIGQGKKDITVEDSVTIIREIARGRVTWEVDEESRYTVPSQIPGLDMTEFAMDAHVPNYRDQLRELREERVEYLEAFGDLDQDIKSGF